MKRRTFVQHFAHQTLVAPLTLGALGTAVGAAVVAPSAATAAAAGNPATDPATLQLIRAGGVVIAMRHALAPGTFDPPQFKVEDCGTQRNLNDAGRDQARRIGQWFKEQKLQPAMVRSSPWCRCKETARLAFGKFEAWTALGSPRGYTEATNAEHLSLLRQRLRNVGEQKPAGFEVWVTHNFVLSDFAGSGASVGEALVLRAAADGSVQVLGRIAAPAL